MGKLIHLKDKTLKRRDKQYNPYKTNPLGKGELTRAISGNELKGAIELDEKGDIKLDEAGKPIFKDAIEWETDNAQLNAIWTCIKALLEEKLVPPFEIEASFDLMTMIARLQREGNNQKFKAVVPINYFVGAWHILNSCRKFDIFSEDKPLSEAIDGLTMDFAKRIDMYHEIKRRESIKEEVSPDNILKLSKKMLTPYYDSGKKETKQDLIEEDQNEY